MKSECTKGIKKILAGVFGAKNVSVRRGNGTAYGWINATVFVDPTSGRNKITETLRRLESVIISEFSGDLSYYYPDDGYDQKIPCFIIQSEDRAGGVKI